MRVTPGYPKPDEVAAAKRSYAAVTPERTNVLVAALTHCESTIDEYARLICTLIDAVNRLDPGLPPDEFGAKYLADFPVRADAYYQTPAEEAVERDELAADRAYEREPF